MATVLAIVYVFGALIAFIAHLLRCIDGDNIGDNIVFGRLSAFVLFWPVWFVRTLYRESREMWRS